MKSKIKKFIDGIGVCIYLRKKEINGTLLYYLIDWLGTDKSYYSLFVMCNETQILAGEKLLIGNCGDLDNCDNLTSNLRQFQEKEDWVIGKWKEDDIVKIDAFLKYQLDHFVLGMCDTEHYHIHKFSVFVRPLCQYVISYSVYNSTRVLSLPMGAKTALCAESEEHYEFITNIIKNLNLENQFSVIAEFNKIDGGYYD